MMQQAFYPFTFPLTVGPGVMVVVLTLSAHAARPTWQGTLLAHAGILVASGLLAILVYLCYGNAPRLQRLLPPSVSAGVLRLMSFVLLCIGAQIAWEGLDLLLKSTGH
jgi:multiple antibiotic resistance protein